MRKFEFTGKWKFEIESKFFSKLNSNKLFRHESFDEHRALLNQLKVPLNITDERTLKPDPELEQINAINFILNNEEKIYQSIYRNLKEHVIPETKKYFDLENEDKETIDYWFPKLTSPEDMKNTIGILGISVDIEYRNDIAWTSYMFEFSADEEHGLIMNFEGDKFLYYGERDASHSQIMAKDEFNKYVKKLNKSHPTQIHVPDPKYGTLKPWQVDANDFYPIALLREKRSEVLFKFLSGNPIIAEKKMETLLNNSKALKFDEITNKLNELKRKL